MTNVSVTSGGGETVQDVETPVDFFNAVNKRWPIGFDLAADKDNKKTISHFSKKDNGLLQDWKEVNDNVGTNKYLWLNPPFGGTSDWMKKCKSEWERDVKIVTLTLSNLGTRWYEHSVQGNALTLILRGRLKFIGHTYSYPKELMINIWDGKLNGFGFWEWRNG